MADPTTIDLGSRPWPKPRQGEHPSWFEPGPSWATLAAALTDLGNTGLARRSSEADRLLRDNGVAVQVVDGPQISQERPWRPDLVPMIIDAPTWAGIVKGVQQRTQVLEAILQDAYGSQRLLGADLHPAAIVAHPGYLRAMHGVQVQRWLTTVAYDLIRDDKGQWLVVADRTQAPSGMGYALETRIATARAMPEAYRACRVERLAPFFLTRRTQLASLAPGRPDNPHIVLLSPGAGSPTYPEHAWLARYLGFSLVEGGDLTVRDDQVFLMTLGGLQRVHVIIRRLDDDWCDPLELRDDSLLGVAGLVAAVRAGQVAIDNALGTGLAENGAILAHFPALCRTLTGQDPLLRTVPTLWGQGLASCSSLHDLMIRPSGHLRSEAVAGWTLSASEQARWLTKIRDEPYQWIGQRIPFASQVPIFSQGSYQIRHVALRVFAGVGLDGQVHVMPGGLTGYHDDPRLVATLPTSGGSKDCWVLADGPVAEVSLLPPAGAPVVLRRGGADLPSRAADSFYWFGRYAERVECLARLLRPCVARLADEVGSPGAWELTVLGSVLERMGLRGSSDISLESRIIALCTDSRLPGGLHDGVRRLRACAAALRDRMSNDTWRAVHHLANSLPTPAMDTGIAGIATALDRSVISGAALAGLAAEGTTRGPGWRFLDLGRRLERAAVTVDLLRSTICSPSGDRALEPVLEVADSAITYRGRYLHTIQAGAVLDLLLTDNTNPRAVAFLLDDVESHVRFLPKDRSAALPSTPERLALGAATWLKMVDPHDLCRPDEDGGRSRLAHLLDHLGHDLEALSDSVTTLYLTHASNPRPITAGWTP